jgi:hypothetical protein
MTDIPLEARRPRRRRRRIAILAGVLVLILVAVGVVTRLLGVWGPESGPEPEAAPSPSPTEAPSPFAGTPAEEFAEGEAGIVLPEAEPMGDFSAEEVAEALELVREALVAARLDQSMLVEHDPESFLSALAPDQRGGRAEQFESGEFGAFATQVAEDAGLAPVPPRVQGEISYDVATVQADRELIEIVSRFTWVYAFEPVGNRPPDLVVVRDELVWRVRGELWLESSRGLWLSEESAQAWGADCDPYEEGLVRPDDQQMTTLLNEPEAIFDPDQPLDSVEGC